MRLTVINNNVTFKLSDGEYSIHRTGVPAFGVRHPTYIEIFKRKGDGKWDMILTLKEENPFVLAANAFYDDFSVRYSELLTWLDIALVHVGVTKETIEWKSM